MTRARQVANFDPALFAADEVSGDKVSGGTIGAGVIGASVTGGAGLSGMTSLGTVTAGNLSNSAIVYPNGHILQVQYGHTATATSVAGTYIDVGLSVDITPTDATNKILVTAHLNMQYNNNGMGFKILRDSTVIKTALQWSNYSSAGGQINTRSSYAILDDISDSPAWSSGSITYKIQASAYTGTHTFNESTNYSEIIAMEVVA